MRRKLRDILETLRESLLFLPVLMIAASIGVAMLAGWLDRSFSLSHVPLLVSVSVDNARAVLATIAGATITVAGTVFALTSVTIQLAATQYSPRIIRGFQRDRFQQLVTGAAAGTFTFCLLSLTSIALPTTETPGPVSQPRVSVTLGVAFGVITIVVIVAFIDHVVRRMRADEVMRRVANETMESVRSTIPTGVDHDELTPSTFPSGEPNIVEAPVSGWVRDVDVAAILEVLPPNSIVRLEVRVGSFASVGSDLASVWLDESTDGRDGASSPNVRAAVEASVDIGRNRAIDNDPLFGLRLLVDIALRALSPSINDPTTAAVAVRHMEAPLSEILARESHRAVTRKDNGAKIYEPHQPSHSEYLREAFVEIRLNSHNQPFVLEALLEVMGSLLDTVTRRGVVNRGEALMAEAAAVLKVAATLPPLDEARIIKVAEREGFGESAGSRP